MSKKRDVLLSKKHCHGGVECLPGTTLRGLDADTAERIVSRDKGSYVDEPAPQTGGVKKVLVSKETDAGPAAAEPKPE